MTNHECQLLELLRDRCYKEGDFTLSSGERSRHYFDAKQVFLASAGASLIGQVLYERTKDLKVDAIGGLEVGAIPITTATAYAYHQHGRKMEGFFVRNQAKDHGTRKLIEGKVSGGSRVVIVDDVVTKGGSIMKAVEAVRRFEMIPILITVLVDRLEGASELFAQQGIAFEPVFTLRDFQTHS